MFKNNLPGFAKPLAATVLFSLFAFATLSPNIVNSQKISEKQDIAYSPVNEITATPNDDFDNVIGGDGAFTVTAANTVLNRYSPLTTSVAAGSTSFTVGSIADLDSPITQLGPLTVGDLLLIIQMQGASINTTDTASYGTVTNLNGAGNYEFVTIGAISGNTITLNGEGCITGLRNGYSAGGRTQIVRVPQFSTLTINAGASVVPTLWNGAVGGVVALQVQSTVTINGTIDASGAGFRGGQLDNNTALGYTGFVTTDSFLGAEKGEGIAGYQTEYDALGGRYGRGAPANGGGGGNNHNAAGGGGANGNNGNAWNGQGVMNSGVTGGGAYLLEGQGFTTSSGGGRGGYSWSDFDQIATLTGPGSTLWGGDNRRQVGGYGGRPVNNDPALRLFLGGGGGAGDANNNGGGAGGRGGGLVIVLASQIVGTGSILANGQAGFPTIAQTSNDAPGGGGAGGTIVAFSANATLPSLTANGGAGGNHPSTTAEGEGGGAGGGGGYIAVRSTATSVTRSAAGGIGGSTSSSSLTEFPRNGSTDGAAGQPTAQALFVRICRGVTSARVGVSGQVRSASGRGISFARVSLTEPSGEVKYATTNPFGYFRFDDVPANQTVIVTVRAKRYTFDNPTQAVVTSGDSTEVNFVANQ